MALSKKSLLLYVVKQKVVSSYHVLLFQINLMRSWLLLNILLHQTTRAREVMEARGTGAKALFLTSPVRYCRELVGNDLGFGCHSKKRYRQIQQSFSTALGCSTHLVMEVTNARKKCCLYKATWSCSTCSSALTAL